MIESSHYYDSTGKAVFEVPKKNGKGMRKTTIADCRKLNLYPSVTTIFSSLSKPQLDQWKLKQVAWAALTLPRPEEDSDEDFVEKVLIGAFTQVDEAANLGTRIHAAIEAFFKGQPYDKELEIYITAINRWIKENSIKFLEHELRLINTLEGYGGTTDAIVHSSRYEGVGILDFKSRKTVPKYPCTPWPTEPMQISAYAKICDSKWGVNLYISTTEPGRVEASWYDHEVITKEFEAFKNVIKVWQHFNKYFPREYIKI